MLGLLSLNMGWIFLFGSARYWAALPVIVIYDVLLFSVLNRLNLDYFGPAGTPLKTKLCVGVPCSIHAGWVTVASVLQLQVNLLEEGWLPSPDFAIGLLVVAIAIAAAHCYARSDLAYALASVWACVGIFSQQSDSSSTFGCASRVCAACDEAPDLLICRRPDSAAVGFQPNGWATFCDGWNATAPESCFVDRSTAVAQWAIVGIIVVLVFAGLGIARAVLMRYLKVATDTDGDEQPKSIEIHGTPSSRDAMKHPLSPRDAALNAGI